MLFAAFQILFLLSFFWLLFFFVFSYLRRKRFYRWAMGGNFWSFLFFVYCFSSRDLFIGCSFFSVSFPAFADIRCLPSSKPCLTRCLTNFDGVCTLCRLPGMPTANFSSSGTGGGALSPYITVPSTKNGKVLHVKRSFVLLACSLGPADRREWGTREHPGAVHSKRRPTTEQFRPSNTMNPD